MAGRLAAIVTLSIFAFTGCGPAPANFTPGSEVQRNAPSANGPVDAPVRTEGSSTSENNSRSASNSAVGNRRKMAELPAGADNSLPPPIPAAENSTITTMMANDGTVTEIRTFVNDRAIDRVTKVSKERDQKATIFLRNGSSVNVPAGKITSLRAISLAELKAMAGIAAGKPGTENERSQKGSVKP